MSLATGAEVPLSGDVERDGQSASPQWPWPRWVKPRLPVTLATVGKSPPTSGFGHGG